MSSEALYEQYKDALKRGHVAALRGRVEEALLAYAEAARIAPERSTPHASAGTALLRRKQPGEALRHFEVALKLAPRDEAALLGRAQSYAALDRRADAAAAFDALAEVHAVAGRLADAVDAARRGLELAEGRERRRTLERLITRLRASEPGEPGRVALERALRVLDGVAVPPPATAARATAPGAAAKAGDRAAPGRAPLDAAPTASTASTVSTPSAASVPGVEPAEVPAAGAASAAVPAEGMSGGPATAGPPAGEPTGSSPELSAQAVADADTVLEDAATQPPELAADLAATPDVPPEAVEPVGGPEAAGVADAQGVLGPEEGGEPQALGDPARLASRPLPAGLDAEQLAAALEAAAGTGVPDPAVETALDLAALHVREGRGDAALDVCYSALAIDPDSVALHLALVELYAGRGWGQLATEKLDLLDRIARLDEDAGAAAAIGAARGVL